jgi:hypothetical protein
MPHDPRYFVMDQVKHSDYYYDYDRNDSDRPNPFSTSNQDFWEEDGFSLTGNPGAMAPDTISFNLTMEPEDKIDLNLDQLTTNGFWKYEEDKTMKDIREYLSSTYKSHYTSQESKTQTLDLIESIGDSEPFCRSNAIKYLSRFGKKNGKSKQDILKAIHYCILLYHFSGLHNEIKGTYETF